MKLRNKKTGEIWDIPQVTEITMDRDKKHYSYSSLAELNENWEDYKPEEPLIKDKKIRKAVRAWAEAIGLSEENTLFVEKPEFDSDILILSYNLNEIRFNIQIPEGMDFFERYKFTDLCGEEE